MMLVYSDVPMPQHINLSLDAIRSMGNEECPHCHAILSH
jgi:hypothetical protein